MAQDEISITYSPIPLPKWFVWLVWLLLLIYIAALFRQPTLSVSYLVYALCNAVAFWVALRLRIRFSLKREGNRVSIQMNRGSYDLKLSQFQEVKSTPRAWLLCWKEASGPMSVRIPHRALSPKDEMILKKLANAIAPERSVA